MKLEKREITLNEKDSLLETFYAEKGLLLEYAYALPFVRRKEARAELLNLLRESGENLCFLAELSERNEE